MPCLPVQLDIVRLGSPERSMEAGICLKGLNWADVTGLKAPGLMPAYEKLRRIEMVAKISHYLGRWSQPQVNGTRAPTSTSCS